MGGTKKKTRGDVELLVFEDYAAIVLGAVTKPAAACPGFLAAGRCGTCSASKHEASGKLPRDPQCGQERRERRRRLMKHDWVVYAKTSLAGAPQVLDYLSRYTHRNAIGNDRLVGINGDNVRFKVRAQAGGKRTIELPGVEFIGRLLQHVLPAGYKRIRHYGLLAPAAKARRLQLARQLLQMPAADRRTSEAVRELMQRVAGIDIERCTHCGGRWRVTEEIEPQRSQGVGAVRAGKAQPRGPP